MEEKSKNNNKKIMTIAIVSVMMIGLCSAALLTYFGTMVGSATVEQSLVINGNDWDEAIEYNIGCVAGNTYINGPFVIENRANQAISIGFETQHLADYDGDEDFTDNVSDAVTTRYLAELKLDNKDSNWDSITSDNREAYLTYELNSPIFNYDLEATGLSAETEYAIIYYADQPDRYENWGGDNPGKLINTFTTDENGNYTGSNSVDLAMNLPKEPDANMQEYDYCDSDSYDLCHGAKIWIIPISDYSEPELTGWNPNNYLFETDLMTYDDTDTDGEGLWVGTGKFNLYIENTFNPLAESGKYKVITKVVPR